MGFFRVRPAVRIGVVARRRRAAMFLAEGRPVRAFVAAPLRRRVVRRRFF
jgi:hypothetical protein